ncbi:CLUMA_CG010394, isoform A [Clunio marinus]|uniref:CLUMA_CG010394, isoform A n=1 Tax=Clunio marinus TaxID=568069 RepID=A0A1J1IEP1_9DIPT|nr:CLUMA_CG010394, isoform A [Clunio marinus]
MSNTRKINFVITCFIVIISISRFYRICLSQENVLSHQSIKNVKNQSTLNDILIACFTLLSALLQSYDFSLIVNSEHFSSAIYENDGIKYKLLWSNKNKENRIKDQQHLTFLHVLGCCCCLCNIEIRKLLNVQCKLTSENDLFDLRKVL